MSLLVESKFMEQFCQICLNPEKYNRYVTSARHDDFSSEQMLLNVSNASVILTKQMFETFVSIALMIVPKSHEILLEYIEMDKILRVIEK